MEFPSTVSDPCGTLCPGLVLCTQQAAVSSVIELRRTGKGQRGLRAESCTSVRVSRTQTEGATFLITGLNLFLSEEDRGLGGVGDLRSGLILGRGSVRVGGLMKIRFQGTAWGRQRMIRGAWR